MKLSWNTRFMVVTIMTAQLAIFSPLGASEADDRVEDAFEQSYVYRTYLKDDAIDMECENGVVTLEGTVAMESHKALAEDTSARLPGVKHVVNQLQTTAEVAADDADTWMARKVKLALLFHRNVSGFGTTVEVTDGVVTLTGEAANEAQKELTTEYASDIENVKSVDNQMTVATTPDEAPQTAGEKIDDASVSAQVKVALLTHRSTSSVKTKVETTDGNVTLTGIAKNEAEKALVTKLVNDIKGVEKVDNKMTIATN